ncbi:hypothetical protein PoB_004925000 [Plakobranchus ocellatus]|uniref:FHA domain-containing protein n=1 Tax=Plakobranchus ocellatus TaxID=259542 RepID=A0AAV4BTX0_9GAST|nr:hypothetical protein PoB_004925000 [Plakobranchus ocellatus]
MITSVSVADNREFKPTGRSDESQCKYFDLGEQNLLSRIHCAAHVRRGTNCLTITVISRRPLKAVSHAEVYNKRFLRTIFCVGKDKFGSILVYNQSTTSDPRFSGPPSGQNVGGGARTRDRRVPADLRADSHCATDALMGKDRGRYLEYSIKHIANIPPLSHAADARKGAGPELNSPNSHGNANDSPQPLSIKGMV